MLGRSKKLAKQRGKFCKHNNNPKKCAKCSAEAALADADRGTGRGHQNLHDNEGRNRNGIRYRSKDTNGGRKGTRIMPGDKDW